MVLGEVEFVLEALDTFDDVFFFLDKGLEAFVFEVLNVV